MVSWKEGLFPTPRRVIRAPASNLFGTLKGTSPPSESRFFIATLARWEAKGKAKAQKAGNLGLAPPLTSTCDAKQDRCQGTSHVTVTPDWAEPLPWLSVCVPFHWESRSLLGPTPPPTGRLLVSDAGKFSAVSGYREQCPPDLIISPHAKLLQFNSDITNSLPEWIGQNGPSEKVQSPGNP